MPGRRARSVLQQLVNTANNANGIHSTVDPEHASVLLLVGLDLAILPEVGLVEPVDLALEFRDRRRLPRFSVIVPEVQLRFSLIVPEVEPDYLALEVRDRRRRQLRCSLFIHSAVPSHLGRLKKGGAGV